MNDKIIKVKDGLNTSDMRILIEITNKMVRAINYEEFYKIMGIYVEATERLLKDIE